jgi:hypothetical protein
MEFVCGALQVFYKTKENEGRAVKWEDYLTIDTHGQWIYNCAKNQNRGWVISSQEQLAEKMAKLYEQYSDFADEIDVTQSMLSADEGSQAINTFACICDVFNLPKNFI